MSRHTFTRRNGTRFELVLGIDHDKLALDMAQSMTRSDKKFATRCGGAITATIRELPEN